VCGTMDSSLRPSEHHWRVQQVVHSSRSVGLQVFVQLCSARRVVFSYVASSQGCYYPRSGKHGKLRTIPTRPSRSLPDLPVRRVMWYHAPHKKDLIFCRTEGQPKVESFGIENLLVLILVMFDY
jgi:hypothetical protein